jgi:hypothetical protein
MVPIAAATTSSVTPRPRTPRSVDSMRSILIGRVSLPEPPAELEGDSDEYPLDPNPYPTSFQKLRFHHRDDGYIWADNELHRFALETVDDATGLRPLCICGWKGSARYWNLYEKGFYSMWAGHLSECYKREAISRAEYQNKLLEYVADSAEDLRYMRGLLEKIRLPQWLLKTSK